MSESSITRRAAVKLLGLAPVAGALTWPDLLRKHVSAASQRARSNEPVAAPAFFSAHEFRTLGVLADDIIPRDARSGSASDAKAPEFIDFMLADKEASLSDRSTMRGGLAWLDHECAGRFEKGYADCSDAQRHQVLDDIAWPAKAQPEMSQGAAFFSRARDAVASAFFSSSMGWRDLGYQGNVFNPGWNGCPQPALDKLGVSYEAYNASLAGKQRK